MNKYLQTYQEKLLFVVSGGVQYLLDIGIFAFLVFVIGNNLYINMASRVGAGVAGFYINGYVVFKSLKGQDLKRVITAAIKFLLLLFLMTIISSVLLSFFLNQSSLHFIIAKGVVEIILAISSFFIQKYLIYKRNIN